MSQPLWIWLGAILVLLAMAGILSAVARKRRKVSEGSDELSAELEADVAASDVATKVVLSAEEVGDPIAEIELFQSLPGEKLREHKQSENLKVFLGPIVQRLPELFSRGRDAFGGAYRVRFSPQVAFDLVTGKARLLQTTSGTLKATAVRASGSPTIIGGGNVVATAGNPAAIALVVWQIAAIVTAQKYLADIDKKLAELQTTLNEVLQLIQDQMFGTLAAHVSLLERKHDQIKRCDLSDSERTSLAVFFDRLEHDSLAAVAVANEQVRKLQGRALVAARDNNKDDLFSALEGLSTYTRLWCAASYTRLLGLQVKSLLPSDRQLLQAELDDAEKRSKEFFAQREGFVRELRLKDKSSGQVRRHPVFATKHHPQVVRTVLKWDKLARDTESKVAALHAVTEQVFDRIAPERSGSLEICMSVNRNGQIHELQLVDKRNAVES
jgi:hypothetical protein